MQRFAEDGTYSLNLRAKAHNHPAVQRYAFVTTLDIALVDYNVRTGEFRFRDSKNQPYLSTTFDAGLALEAVTALVRDFGHPVVA